MVTSTSGALMYSEVQTESMNDIVLQYAPLVKRIAHHLLLRMPSSVQLDDLIQSGMIGLLEAAKKYDLTKGGGDQSG